MTPPPPRQQVNLYQPEAGPPRGLLGADSLAFAATAVIAALLVVWGLGTWRIDRLQRAVQGLQTQHQRAEQALGALGAASVASANPADIKARIQQLQAKLAARERALALLQDGSVGGTSGFSAELAALARRPVRGLWLQRISLFAAGNSMSLAGEVLEPDLVPRYLRGLATERELSSVRFDRLVIEMSPMAHAHAKSGPPAPVTAFTFQAGDAGRPVAQVAEAGERLP